MRFIFLAVVIVVSVVTVIAFWSDGVSDISEFHSAPSSSQPLNTLVKVKETANPTSSRVFPPLPPGSGFKGPSHPPGTGFTPPETSPPNY